MIRRLLQLTEVTRYGAAGVRVDERGEISTFPDTLTTQGLSLWFLNIVGGEILTFKLGWHIPRCTLSLLLSLGSGPYYPYGMAMVFEHSGRSYS